MFAKIHGPQGYRSIGETSAARDRPPRFVLQRYRRYYLGGADGNDSFPRSRARHTGAPLVGGNHADDVNRS